MDDKFFKGWFVFVGALAVAGGVFVVWFIMKGLTILEAAVK